MYVKTNLEDSSNDTFRIITFFFHLSSVKTLHSAISPSVLQLSMQKYMDRFY
jgi:hypothetical protein